MTFAHLLAIAWSPDPSVFGGSVALLVAYLAWLRGRVGPRALVFVAGVGLLLFTLVGPLDRIGELYLFSVHMVQHLLLILVVPPLLLWGLPVDATRRLFDVRLVRRVEGVVGRPLVALTVAIVTLWAWHLPPLYDLALRNESVHALEHLLFLITATMFWWPVLTPVRERRLSPPVAMAYLFAGMASDAGLGVTLTFAPTPLYPFYAHPPDPYGALPLIRDVWHVTQLQDQQMGGLAMWIPGGIFYIVAILVEFGLWFGEPDSDEDLPVRTTPRPGSPLPEPPAARPEPALAGREHATRRSGASSHAAIAADDAPCPTPRHQPAALRGILEGAR